MFTMLEWVKSRMEIKPTPGQMIGSWRFADVLRKEGKHIHDWNIPGYAIVMAKRSSSWRKLPIPINHFKREVLAWPIIRHFEREQYGKLVKIVIAFQDHGNHSWLSVKWLENYRLSFKIKPHNWLLMVTSSLMDPVQSISFHICNWYDWLWITITGIRYLDQLHQVRRDWLFSIKGGWKIFVLLILMMRKRINFDKSSENPATKK